MKQCKDVPTIKAALEVAEWILAKRTQADASVPSTPRRRRPTEPISEFTEGLPVDSSQNHLHSELITEGGWMAELFGSGMLGGSFLLDMGDGAGQ